MTPEAQRIAIARVLYPRFSDIEIYAHLSDNDYLNDLNDMHEAEKMLTVGQMQRANYIDQLQIVVGTEGLHSYSAYTATAAQRAEAFLRTLGLWVGG